MNVLTDIQTNMHVCVCVHLHPHRVEQAEVAQEETLVTESSFWPKYEDHYNKTVLNSLEGQAIHPPGLK